MKKKQNQRAKLSEQAKVLQALRYYESQSDDAAAREIETAPEVKGLAWMRVPQELVPQVRRLIARHKKSA